MNLRDAIVSKKAFRRPHWKLGYFIEASENGLFHSSEHVNGVRSVHPLSVDDVIAVDYELCEEYELLLKEGNVLFSFVKKDLDRLSKSHIRTQRYNARREEDVAELKLALALLSKKGILVRERKNEEVKSND